MDSSRDFRLYWSFLKTEIPSMVQILTFAGFLDALTNLRVLRMLYGMIVFALLANYLREKAVRQIALDPVVRSAIEHTKAGDEGRLSHTWSVNATVTASVLGFIVAAIGIMTPSSSRLSWWPLSIVWQWLGKS